MSFKRPSNSTFATNDKKIKLDDLSSCSHAEDFTFDLTEDNDDNEDDCSVEKSFFDDIDADFICSQFDSSAISNNNIPTFQRPQTSTAYQNRESRAGINNNGESYILFISSLILNSDCRV